MSLYPQLFGVLCRCFRSYWCVMSLYPLLWVCYVVVSAVIGVLCRCFLCYWSVMSLFPLL